MTEPSAKVLLDSISEAGDRITTVEVTHHRFILAETNTHRALSRNSASSRATPCEKQLNRFREDPAFPVVWRSEQPGMTAGGELEGDDLKGAKDLFEMWHWQTEGLISFYYDQLKQDHGEDWKQHALHKSWVARLLEPMQWHTAIWTFDHNLLWNLLNQRVHKDAQPEFLVMAEKLKAALEASEPQPLDPGQWHMPLLREEDTADVRDLLHYNYGLSGGESYDAEQATLRKTSVARCARVSYLNHDGVRDITSDIKMFDERLLGQEPPHCSPFEHVCTPADWNKTEVSFESPITNEKYFYKVPLLGNLYGWLQMRHAVGYP